MATLDQIVSFYQDLQDRICAGLEDLDGGARFQEDLWTRGEGGGGRTRLISNGKVFEKGGVNFSHVWGPMPEKIAQRLEVPVGSHFNATGVSIVIHPASPKVPIIHANWRYFEMENGRYWFGGGIDLTPIYVTPEQAGKFHAGLKSICDNFDPDYYPRFKKWCDEYFFIRHRGESRGIGGVFYDFLKGESVEEKQALFEFVQALSNSFVDLYREPVLEGRNQPFTEREKDFQLLRRSRYVEFNLVYDKGTKFGLDTGGRTESILMSMPPLAKWVYDYQPEPGSPEAATLEALRQVNFSAQPA